MWVLVTYDVSTTMPAGRRRLRRVARACEDYGQRVQKSVFECRLGMTEWVALRERLLREASASEDSLRFYFLEDDVRIEHHGAGEPVDLKGPLVI